MCVCVCVCVCVCDWLHSLFCDSTHSTPFVLILNSPDLFFRRLPQLHRPNGWVNAFARVSCARLLTADSPMISVGRGHHRCRVFRPPFLIYSPPPPTSLPHEQPLCSTADLNTITDVISSARAYLQSTHHPFNVLPPHPPRYIYFKSELERPFAQRYKILIFCSVCASCGVWWHPHHTNFLGGAHTIADIDETLAVTARAFQRVANFVRRTAASHDAKL